MTASRNGDCGPDQRCYQTRARYPGEPINQWYPLAWLRNHVFRLEVDFVFHATKPGKHSVGDSSGSIARKTEPPALQRETILVSRALAARGLLGTRTPTGRSLTCS